MLQTNAENYLQKTVHFGVKNDCWAVSCKENVDNDLITIFT